MLFVVKEMPTKTSLEFWLNQYKEQIVEWQVILDPEKYEYIVIAKLKMR